MTIDWKAFVILIGAWAFSRFAPAPERIKLLVFAAACFGIAGLRAIDGLGGNNLIFVLIAGGFGAFYVVRALKLPRG
ncbi:MAG: hypothetical protein JNM69_23760 [Archangium sp.]|nr:hypothetical protein [Archangium sp.]